MHDGAASDGPTPSAGRVALTMRVDVTPTVNRFDDIQGGRTRVRHRKRCRLRLRQPGKDRGNDRRNNGAHGLILRSDQYPQSNLVVARQVPDVLLQFAKANRERNSQDEWSLTGGSKSVRCCICGVEILLLLAGVNPNSEAIRIMISA